MSDVLKPGDPCTARSTLPDQSGTKSRCRFPGPQGAGVLLPQGRYAWCTTQACALRDVLGDVGSTAVIGISPDPPKRQAAFDRKYSLGFPLLSDVSHTVAESYGVWVERSMYGRTYMGIERSAFLVGEDGTLAKVWYKVAPAATAENLLKALA